MQIRIIKCSSHTYWYTKEIGNCFYADRGDKANHDVNIKVPIDKDKPDGKFEWRAVYKRDCELV